MGFLGRMANCPQSLGRDYMTADVKIQICPGRVDLFIRREEPAYTWPNGEFQEWECFSFPLRCREAVEALARECEGLEKGRGALVRSRRREILWL